jgi:hypothetical protein
MDLPPMMRSPGMVQALALKSISSHLALIASEVRGAVRIVICKVGGPPSRDAMAA